MKYKNIDGTCPVKSNILVRTWCGDDETMTQVNNAGNYVWGFNIVNPITEFEPIDHNGNPLAYHDIVWIKKPESKFNKIDSILNNNGEGIHPFKEQTCDELATEVNSGGSTPSQYAIPSNSKDLQDLIEHKQMSFTIGNIFKAAYRIGSKNDELYEINKILWFADRRKNELMK